MASAVPGAFRAVLDRSARVRGWCRARAALVARASSIAGPTAQHTIVSLAMGNGPAAAHAIRRLGHARPRYRSGSSENDMSAVLQHLVSRKPIVFALFVVLGVQVALGTSARIAFAFNPSSQITFSLEGCRNN